jgi:hypothetical protein
MKMNSAGAPLPDVVLRCADCRACLVDIYITDPEAEFVWQVKANCPFCGGASYAREIKGLYHPGGHGETKPDDPTDDVPSTFVDDYSIDGGVVHFLVRKAGNDAVPVR